MQIKKGNVSALVVVPLRTINLASAVRCESVVAFAYRSHLKEENDLASLSFRRYRVGCSSAACLTVLVSWLIL